MKLVLFDIDGTLLTDCGASRDAFGDALREVYDYAGDLSRYDFSGRTDPQIAHMVLKDAGFGREDIEARMPRLWDLYLAELARNATPDRVRVMRGCASSWQHSTITTTSLWRCSPATSSAVPASNWAARA